MPCYKPLNAYQSVFGGITFNRKESTGHTRQVQCGQCIGCKIDRSRQWAVRCCHEASLHEDNSFITLTYNEENIPDNQSLDHEHFQLFMKRLRKKFHDKKIKFYMCGEYGIDQDDKKSLGRPHYHALLFGIEFPDKWLYKVQRGEKYYRSPILEKLWQFGYSDISNVTFRSAAYVARYVTKKITGDMAESHYQKVNKKTGELHKVKPEYNKMSLRPAIAKDWYEKFSDDVFPQDICVINGKKFKTPRYYEKLLKTELGQGAVDYIKETRKIKAEAHLENNTPERLKVREEIQAKKLTKLKRDLSYDY